MESLKLALGGSVATAGALADCPFQGDSAHNTGLFTIHPTAYPWSVPTAYPWSVHYTPYCLSLVCSLYTLLSNPGLFLLSNPGLFSGTSIMSDWCSGLIGALV